ncbi:hypothetical protein DIPPA_04935 [Diplonema papillatum]|nr:hypothetical protein DIPPA_04935 [Diplonema papillatum]
MESTKPRGFAGTFSDDEEDDDDDDMEPEVQVYHFSPSTKAWVEQGFGIISTTSKPKPFLKVISDSHQYIINEPLFADVQYEVDGCGVTYWSRPDNVEKALTFDHPAHCQRVHHAICVAVHEKHPDFPKQVGPASMGKLIDALQHLPVFVTIGWVTKHDIIHKLLALVHHCGIADPKVSNPEVHAVILQVHVAVRHIIKIGSRKILQRVTEDPKLWLHYLMIEDYAAWSEKLGGAAVGKGKPVVPKPKVLTNSLSPDERVLSNLTPPWTREGMPFTHCESFEAGGEQKRKSAGHFTDPAIEPKIHQSARCAYWIERIVAAETTTGAPAAAALEFVTVGTGAWEGMAIQLKDILRKNAAFLARSISKDAQFVKDLLAALGTAAEGPADGPVVSQPESKAADERKKTAFAFLFELFTLSQTAFHEELFDVCAALAEHGLYDALFNCLHTPMAEASARLLEFCMGGGPKPCTFGSSLKKFLLNSIPTDPALKRTSGSLGAGDSLPVARSPSLAQQASLSPRFRLIALSCIGCLPHQPDGVAAAVMENMHEIVVLLLGGSSSRKSVGECGVRRSTDDEQVESAATDAGPVPLLDAQLLSIVIRHVLPVWFERLAALPAETAYTCLSSLCNVLERDSVELPDADKAWRMHVRHELTTYFVAGNVLTADGAVEKTVRKHLEEKSITAAVARLHRCLLQSGVNDVYEHYSEHKILGSFLQFVADRTDRKSSVVTSAVLGLLTVLKSRKKVLRSLLKDYGDKIVTDDGDRAVIQELRDFVSSERGLWEPPKQGQNEPFGPMSPLVSSASGFGFRGGGEPVDEVGKAYNALVSLEEIRSLLEGHYLSLCDAMGIEPAQPHRARGKAEVMSPQQYADVYAKVAALESMPKVPPRRSSLQKHPQRLTFRTSGNPDDEDVLAYVPQPPKRLKSQNGRIAPDSGDSDFD